MPDPSWTSRARVEGSGRGTGARQSIGWCGAPREGASPRLRGLLSDLRPRNPGVGLGVPGPEVRHPRRGRGAPCRCLFGLLAAHRSRFICPHPLSLVTSPLNLLPASFISTQGVALFPCTSIVPTFHQVCAGWERS